MSAGDTGAPARAANGAAAEVPAAGGPTTAKRPGLAVSTLPAVIYAMVFAAGITTVEWLVAYYQGSYIAGEVFVAVILVWMGAAAAATLVLSVVLLPLLAAVKSNARVGIVTAVIVAAGFALGAVSLKGNFLYSDAIGGVVFFNVVFLCIWGVVLGALTAALMASGLRGQRWPVAILAVGSIVFCTGLSCYIWPRAAGYTLVIGPLMLLSIGVVVMQRLKSAKVRTAVTLAACVVFAAALFVTARAQGRAPLSPIDKGFTPELSKTAMLAGKPNVVLVTFDTTRADHMSLCGYKYPTTPNLVKLAEDARLFPNASTVDSWTLPAHAALFTGKFPRENGCHAAPSTKNKSMEVVELYGIPLAPSQKTIASILSSLGYNTAGFAGNYAWVSRQFGLDQGFSYFSDTPRFMTFTRTGALPFKIGIEIADRIMGRNGKFIQTYWSARSLTTAAQKWVHKSKSSPFFLFMNYMDPHEAYAPPPPFDHIDGPDIEINRMVAHHDEWEAIYDKFINTGKGLDPKLLAQAINQYDGEIAYTDHWLGKLIETLKAEGVYDETLIIVTCDHGEFFGEHGFLDHGTSIYEEGVRVPILVKYPRQAHAGEVAPSRVSIIDAFGTIADELRIKPQDVTAQPLDRVTHPIILEQYPDGKNIKRYGKRFDRHIIATYDGQWKYTRNSDGHNELYDLAADPGEMTNLVEERPEVVAKFNAGIDDWLAKSKEFDGTKEMVKGAMSKETLKRLGSVGYLNPSSGD